VGAAGQIKRDIQSRVPFGTFRLKLLLLSSLPISASVKGGVCVQSRRRGTEKGRARSGVEERLLLVAQIRRRADCKSAGQPKWGEMRCMGWEVTQSASKRAFAKEFISRLGPCIPTAYPKLVGTGRVTEVIIVLQCIVIS
jgi:hypothetical protein